METQILSDTLKIISVEMILLDFKRILIESIMRSSKHKIFLKIASIMLKDHLLKAMLLYRGQAKSQLSQALPTGHLMVTDTKSKPYLEIYKSNSS